MYGEKSFAPEEKKWTEAETIAQGVAKASIGTVCKKSCEEKPEIFRESIAAKTAQCKKTCIAF